MGDGKRLFKVLLVLLLIAIILGVVAVAIFGSKLGLWLGKSIKDIDLKNISVGSEYWYDDENEYSVGSTELEVGRIDSLDIEWIMGNVEIDYWNGSFILIGEDESLSEDQQLRWCVDDNELTVRFCKSGTTVGEEMNKNLHISLPQNMQLSELNCDTVSASVAVDDLTVGSFDMETVSGNADLTSAVVVELSFFSVSGNMALIAAVTPQVIEVETVSGDTALTLPESSGFTASMLSVSGNINVSLDCMIKDRTVTCGDGCGSYEFNTVSGNVTINPPAIDK